MRKRLNPRTVGLSSPNEITLEPEPILKSYDQHLSDVLGLSPGTRRHYCGQVRKFLAALPKESDSGVRLTLTDLVVFVDPVSGEGKSRSLRALAIRSFLRFLNLNDLVGANLSQAILVPVRRRDRALPVGLTEGEIHRIFDELPDTTPTQRRNRVILLLLARLGLRGGEVCHLKLKDIDWYRGEIRIGEGKNRRERKYPMSQEIGEALASYLCQDRPDSSRDEIFVSHLPPFGPLIKYHSLGRIVRRILHSLKIREKGGTHLFRHATATSLVCGGASFKQVSDLLGHKVVGSTFIYAKLDLLTLSRVALPWPGGA